MLNHVVVRVLQGLLALAVLVILLLQVWFLPWLSGVLAQDLPAEAFMRWPVLALAVLGLACVQVGILCTLRLLGLTHRGEVFSAGALRWVDGIIAAFLGGSLVCVATLTYQSFTVGGPPLWMLLLVATTVAGLGMALLMVVMRTLLVRATVLRTELDVVI